MAWPQYGDARGWDGFFSYMRRAFTRATGLKIDGALGVTVDTIAPGEQTGVDGNNDPVYRTSWTIPDAAGGVYFNHSATEAAFTVTMPSAPEDMQEVSISSRSIVTTLTHSAGAGHTIRGGLTTIAANGYARYRFHSTGSYWARIG